MRKITRSFFLMTILILIVFSCRKDSMEFFKDQDLTDPSVALTVDLAKKYYKNLKREKGNSLKDKELQQMFPSEVNNKYVMFKKAYVSQTAKLTFVEVPIFYNRKVTTLIRPAGVSLDKVTAEEAIVAKNSFDRLLIYKNKSTGETSQRIVRYIPDYEYLKRHNFDISRNQINRLDSDFTGYLEYSDWDGKAQFMLYFVNGKLFKKRTYNYNRVASAGKSPGVSGQKQMSLGGPKNTISTTYCQGYVDVHVTTVCYYADPEGFTEVCDTYEEYSNYQEICWEEPDLTGDPCIDYGQCDDTPPTPAPDPNQAHAASIDMMLELRLQYPVVANVVDGLYDKVKNNERLMDAIKQYSHLSQNQILSGLISGEGPKLVVADLPYSSGQYDKQTNTITIDKDVADNSHFISTNYATALELFITACILHEYIHYGENTTQIFTPYTGSQDDPGYQFENSYWGGRVQFNSETGAITYDKIQP